MSKVHKAKIAGKMYEYDSISIRGLENNAVIPVRTVTEAWKVFAKLQKMGINVIMYEATGMIPIFKKVNKLAVFDDVAKDTTPVIVGTEVKSILTFDFKI
jgi:hypothetical protein